MNARQIWKATLEQIQTRVQPSVYDTWFSGTVGLSFDENVFMVGVPSAFAKAQMEVRFIEMIRSLLSEATGCQPEVRFVVTKGSTVNEELQALEQEAALSESPAQRLKRAYRAPRHRPALRAKLDSSSPAIAMTSHAPSSARPVPHRAEAHEEEHEQAAIFLGYERPAEEKAGGGGEQEHLFTPIEGGSMLNPRYTFDTFIVGKSNRLAHAASKAVAERPGYVYNPLFLYGGVGLGKTHLLHAIGHHGEAAGLSVLYTTSEKFTNEIINAIRFQKTEEFRAKYRQIDILLVDDIQFIAGKESTEEEFFHTFNALYDSNKQIVVTSDRPPKAIVSLQDRLRSRFEWGLLADIQPPDYEHRQAILRSKAESMRFQVPPAVIDYIARPECRSVRELEGALKRVIAYATLHQEPLTVSLAAKALEHIYNSKPPATLTVREVLEGVCRYYNVDPEQLRGKARDREIVWPRQVAMYVMREQTDASLLQIGAELGGRDHTTIMHGWEKVQAEMATNDRVRREIAAVIETIEQSRMDLRRL
ncbi:chromosomal replication initiator protein DnaA [Thermogemmatispora carboxidivorans]|uniref:chromosomal replication initiator protein DnaA n=1 Tax=Thermogemmatispora carboxidivorans TaxID=1382306 RepID=UPI00069944E3|nr:chromosomal replication initiator protein DnaA [Thermogemmatispora carboxidivorans]